MAMTADEVNVQLLRFWQRSKGVGRAPTVYDLWMEQERVAEMDGGVLPTLRQVVEHFSWFFTEPELDENGR
ncbi:MAG: hypothetical protein WCG36_08865, partial [bacterium]